jgi:hypothetical protein
VPDASTGGLSNVLVWVGKNRDLQLERAHSWTAGLELEPQSISGLGTALTYFDTHFSNRLSSPVFTNDLLSNSGLAPLVTRDPTAAYREDVCSRAPISSGLFSCTTTPVAAIADLRTRNDALVRTRGLDLIAKYLQPTHFGQFTFSFNGTYIIDFEEAKASYLPLQEHVSTPSYPVDLRMRGSAGFQRGAFNVTTFVNFLDDYEDTASLPNRHVSSWTTFDMTMAYTFGERTPTSAGNTTLILGAENLMDRQPPFLNNVVGIGYDQENGDLTGRVVSLTIQTKW